jgi:hypothetical protein
MTAVKAVYVEADSRVSADLNDSPENAHYMIGPTGEVKEEAPPDSKVETTA